MLDEKREYNEYSCNLNAEDAVARLKYSSLSNNLSGTDRAMTIIARHFIFENGPLNRKNKEEQIKRARNALRLWCAIPSEDMQEQGLQTEAVEDTKKQNSQAHSPADMQMQCSGTKAFEEERRLNCWMYRYLNEYLPVKSGSDCSKIINEFKEKRKKYEESLYEQIGFKSITFEREIAKAMRTGPLKRYYLAAQHPCLDENRKPVKGLELYSQENKGIKNASDLMLKLTAALLLEEKNVRKISAQAKEGTAFRKYNNKDLANWCILNKIKGPEHIDKTRYKGKSAIIRKINEKGEDTAYARLDPKFLKDFGWRILEENELDEFLDKNPDGIFYSDQGSGKELALNTRYL